MKVEVFHKDWSMGEVSFDQWDAFEKYLLRWLTQPVHIIIKFDCLQEQIMWYADVLESVRLVHQAQNNLRKERWDISIHRFDQVVNTFALEVA